MSRRSVYGDNFRKARSIAIARSGGKCQLCGIRQAEEGHHWAWPNYPPDDEVQSHDITALCKPCHEYATVLRDWTQRKGADFDMLAMDLDTAKSFFEKREIFSYWLFPEDQAQSSHTYHSVISPRQQAVSHTAKKYKDPKNRSQGCLAFIFSTIIILVVLAILMEVAGYFGL